MIEPIDFKRCQAETVIGQLPFQLGGTKTHVRCTKSPSYVLIECEAGKDGERGHMSVCGECLETFIAKRDKYPAVDIHTIAKRKVLAVGKKVKR